MKHYINKLLLSLSFLLVFSTTGQAQSGTRTPVEDMVNAIRNDRVVDMVKFFDNFVPLTINNNQAIYSHNQAEVILKDFFDKNIPREFTVMDNGSPDNYSKFIIGSFTATNGVKFNVYILMRLKDGNYMLQDLRLNRE
ncbi:MAG: hypothetical protein JWQ38_1644 [Flavipsychrobacter sp.]|nr:hypothetical protein [Flavipsychrobacter sp.]